jgi:hypothetical protein
LRIIFALCLSVMAVCGPPPRNYPPVVDLRVCVQGEAAVEVYRRYFTAATAAEPDDGRECDVTIRRSLLNAGKVIARSAYDGSVLAEVLGPGDIAPPLIKNALQPGTKAYERVTAQRAEPRPYP